MADDIILETRGLVKEFKGFVAVNQVSLKVKRGGIHALIGPNGAGKTSLLKVLAGLLPYEGEVRFFERSLMDCPLRERAQQLAWLSQQDVAGDDLSVYDLVMLGRLPHQSGWGGASAVDHTVVEQCLQALNLVDWRDRRLGSLSGGERQRVLLARALAVQAAVLLMDEPIANVDAPNVVQWLSMVQGMTAQGQTVVSVLHDLNLALRADRVVVMHEGQVLIQAPAHDPALHTCLQQVFEHALTFHFWQDRWIALPR